MPKRVKRNKHQGMTKKLLHRKQPMSMEQKNERKKLQEESRERQREIDRKAGKKSE